jgi:hypothetical protein
MSKISYDPPSTVMLYRLLPQPVVIRENGITGRLFVDGNIDANCLLLRLLFDDPEEVVPVMVSVRIGGGISHYALSGRDPAGPMVKSSVLFPRGSVAGSLEITAVKPFVSVSAKKSEKNGKNPPG